MESFLRQAYGGKASQQLPRYTAAVEAFRGQYGAGEIFLFRAPGRVNLIGEHTDYNHGYVMPVALDKDVLLLARPRQDNLIRLCNVEPKYQPFSFEIEEEIPISARGHWSNYARGVAQNLAQRMANGSGKRLTGFDGLVSAAAPFGVPRGAGLSSSSALTVAAATALAHFNGWQPPVEEMVGLCSDAEWYVGTRGGVMDHFIAVMGKRDHALFLDCRPGQDGSYLTHHEPLPRAYSLLIVDSGVKHRNVGNDFNRRVAACRAGSGLLRAPFPQTTRLRDVEDIPWHEIEPYLPEEMTPGGLAAVGIELGDIPGITPETTLQVRSRCRHVWSENRRVQEAVKAMTAGDVGTLGRLLGEAHASARDDYEISCPEIERLVALLTASPGVLGARLTGAGWGGCVVALVENEAVEAVSRRVQEAYEAQTGIQPSVFACLPSDGAGLLAHINGRDG